MSDMQPQGAFKSPADLKTFHESSELGLKGIVVFTIFLILLCAATMVGLKMVMSRFVADEVDAKGADASSFDRRRADRRPPTAGRPGP